MKKLSIFEIAAIAKTGNYPASALTDVDCIVGQSFGTSIHKGSPNSLLAKFIAYLHDTINVPIIAQQEIAEILQRDYSITPDCIVKGDPSTKNGEGLTSYGVLSKAKEFMQKTHWRPMIITQAFLAARASRQAQILNASPVLPYKLPRIFDPESDQRWTRNLRQWLWRENFFGLLYLKFVMGKL
jgi:hypothetical protein